MCVISALSATTLADTVARIPRNSNFCQRIEFSDIFEHFIGRRTATLTQAVVFLNLLSQNLAAIVACAQMFDSFAGAFWPGASIALRISPAPVVWVRWDATSCGNGKSPVCVPFASEGQDALLISAGYVACCSLFAPLGLLTLEENMHQQTFSFFALLLLSVQFVFAFCSTGLHAGSVPWIGVHWVDTVGVVMRVATLLTRAGALADAWLPLVAQLQLCILRDCAFVAQREGARRQRQPRLLDIDDLVHAALHERGGAWRAGLRRSPREHAEPPGLGAGGPAHAAERHTLRRPHHRTRSWSKSLPRLLSPSGPRLLRGVIRRRCSQLGGLRFRRGRASGATPGLRLHFTRSGFGVPIFCVIMRYNLVNGGLCSEPWAHVWSSVLPWGTAWTLYQGSVTRKLLDYSGLVLNGFTDFVAPGVGDIARDPTHRDPSSSRATLSSTDRASVPCPTAVTLISLGAARHICCYRWHRTSGTLEPRKRGDSSSTELLRPVASTPIQPFPAVLRPLYVEIVGGMVALLLVVLPVAVWLQICGKHCRVSTDF